MINKTAIVENCKLGRDVSIGLYSLIKDAQIGDKSKIWHYANIYSCEIGENCNIGSYVEIQDNVKVGNSVIISSHSFICSLVTIEDDVFVGHGVKTINDIYPPSRRATGSSKHWQKTLIKRRAIIGSNATLFPVTIGERSVIGAGSVVTRDIPSGEVWAGNPAKYIKKVSELTYGERLPVYPDLKDENSID